MADKDGRVNCCREACEPRREGFSCVGWAFTAGFNGCRLYTAGSFNGTTPLGGDSGTAEGTPDTYAVFCISEGTGACTDTGLVITSHSDKQLEARNGTVGMHGDRRGWQEWSLESAKDETVFIVTGGGKRLEERGGRAAVTDDRVDRQRWRLEPAKDGKFFIVRSHGGKMLVDRDGRVGVTDDRGDSADVERRQQSRTGAVLATATRCEWMRCAYQRAQRSMLG